jgi:hypothetical protein
MGSGIGYYDDPDCRCTEDRAAYFRPFGLLLDAGRFGRCVRPDAASDLISFGVKDLGSRNPRDAIDPTSLPVFSFLPIWKFSNTAIRSVAIVSLSK